jgi:hypothetical protein
LRLLEEKHSDVLEQLKESQASMERVVASKVVADEKFQHFNGLYKGMRLELKEAKAKAADYLHQLSFALRVRDSAWASPRIRDLQDLVEGPGSEDGPELGQC